MGRRSLQSFQDLLNEEVPGRCHSLFDRGDTGGSQQGSYHQDLLVSEGGDGVEAGDESALVLTGFWKGPGMSWKAFWNLDHCLFSLFLSHLCFGHFLFPLARYPTFLSLILVGVACSSHFLPLFQYKYV